MKKIFSVFLIVILLTACSSTLKGGMTDTLTKFAAVEQGTAMGAARITFPRELTKNKILEGLEAQDQAEDVVLEFFFNAKFDEPGQKAKISVSDGNEKHLADIYMDSEKYYVEMNNIFSLLSDKMGTELPFTKKDMNSQKFLNIPKTPWQSHLPSLYTALNAAITSDENLAQEQDEYYHLTLTSSEFAASLTSPFKAWMADGYELVYRLAKKDLSQALTLTISNQIKIELQWSIDAQEPNIAMPEGVLLGNVLGAKREETKPAEAKPVVTEPEKNTTEAPKKVSSENPVEDPADKPNEEVLNKEQSEQDSTELEFSDGKTGRGLKPVMKSIIKSISPDRKLLTANIFNQNTNMDALMNSTVKWLSPLMESYRQTDANFTYLGLTSLPPESCLPSERDAINVNFYKMGDKREFEAFIEYDEPEEIKQMLNTYTEVCEKCGYTMNKDALVELIDVLARDARLLIKGTEKDYYMEETQAENVKLIAYIAFTGDKYIYMITLSETCP